MVYYAEHQKLSELNEPLVQYDRKEDHMLLLCPLEPKADLSGFLMNHRRDMGFHNHFKNY